MLCVDAIHRAEVTQVREINSGARNVIETLARRLENCREILKDTLCLGHNTPLDHLASGRVLADLAAEAKETTDFDRLGKRAGRRRDLRSGNCGLVHSKAITARTDQSSNRVIEVRCGAAQRECLRLNVCGETKNRLPCAPLHRIHPSAGRGRLARMELSRNLARRDYWRDYASAGGVL